MIAVFKRGTGITIDTVPVELLAISSSYREVAGEFRVETLHDHGVVERILREAGFTRLEMFVDIINVYPNNQEQVAVATGGEAIQGPDGPIQLEHDENEEVERDEDEEEANEEVAGEWHPPTPNMFDITRESLLQRLPNLVTPEDASSMKLCTDKIREYERIWGQAITLKRQIDSMMVVIDQIEIFRRMSADLAYLTEKCECIDSMKIGQNGLLFIMTKEIVTANQPQYGSRLLGKMRISIDLEYVYPKNSPNTNYTKAIQIHNLDRNPYNGNSYWSCGHVRNSHEDGQSICWGSYYPQLFDAFVAKDLTQLFDTIIRFIINPNEPDEWGCRIRFFPEVNASES